MCLLHSLEKYLKEEEISSAGTWSPFRVGSRGATRTTQERNRLFSSIITFFEKSIVSAFNSHEGPEPIKERNYYKEFRKFSELDRITKDASLSTKEKIKLISRPSRSDIGAFLKKLFKYGEVQYEVQIYALLLLSRFLTTTGWKLRATHWRILLITATRIAQKFEGRHPMRANVLEHIYPLFSVEEFTHLENHFLHIIDYRCFTTYEQYTNFLRNNFESCDKLHG
mmetsp:Transcript_49051/g.56385  ORF Transcript_49051/g.56385 Transcript_49051/m.56385 type:complete len:225 (+) Transcript_49051:137-811(+)